MYDFLDASDYERLVSGTSIFAGPESRRGEKKRIEKERKGKKKKKKKEKGMEDMMRYLERISDTYEVERQFR